MRMLIFIIALTVSSCTKDGDCQTCHLIEESNISEAILKCNGNANRYPQFNEIRRNTSIVCSSSERQRLMNMTNENTTLLCDDVWATSRLRLSCN